MAHQRDHSGPVHEGDHVVPVSLYVRVLTALMILLVLTVAAAFIDFDERFHIPDLSMSIALIIAFTKALLIMLFFMHIKYGSKITAAFAASAFVWLGILMVLSMSDYLTRQNPVTSPSGIAVPVAPSPEIQRPPPRHDQSSARPTPPAPDRLARQ